MKKIFLFLFAAVPILASVNGTLKLDYEIDITNIESDSFYVTLNVDGIKSDSIVFQFAVTAPGIYSKINAGRFAGNFRAFDGQGNLLPVNRPNVNQIIIYESARLKKITYSVEDTYDSKIKGDRVISCTGSNIEDDNAVFNAQVVCGYFHGYQKNPVNILFIYPEDWVISTALTKAGDGYIAKSYDELVDSPVMMGKLTMDKFIIYGTTIEVSCYSQNKVITAAQLSEKLKPYIEAVAKMLGEVPVNRYVFIYYFTKEIGGWALEHNYSSYHALPESSLNGMIDIGLISTHEFCHIVTPLHIRSKIIDQFNFAVPTPTANLWFYEGFVDWMARMAMVRGGIRTVDEFLDELGNYYGNFYLYLDTTLSLKQSSITCYTNNIEWLAAYYRGCMLGVLIDLELLKLSQGKTGLIDVIKRLYKIYDKGEAFADSALIDIIGEATYPQIRTMLDKYVNGTEQLPVGKFMKEVGCEYHREIHTGKYKGYARKWIFQFIDGDTVVTHLDVQDSLVILLGIKEGDKFKKLIFKGEEISVFNPRFREIRDSVEIGIPVTWVVERNGRELQLTTLTRKVEIVEYHKITLSKDPTNDQILFRNKWLSIGE